MWQTASEEPPTYLLLHLFRRCHDDRHNHCGGLTYP